MTDERRVEVAAEALAAWALDLKIPALYLDAARAVVAALNAHDGDLRERLAGAVEAMGHGDYFHGSAWPQSDAGDYCGRCANAEEAARIVREWR